MYLIRVDYDCNTHKTAATWPEAQQAAKGWGGAYIVDCDDIRHGDNFAGWQPVNPRGTYMPNGELIDMAEPVAV